MKTGKCNLKLTMGKIIFNISSNHFLSIIYIYKVTLRWGVWGNFLYVKNSLI